MRNRLLVIGFFSCLSLFAAVFFLKDPCATWLIRKEFVRAFPDLSLRISGVSLLPGRLVIRRLDVRPLVKNASAEVKFTPWWWGRGPVLVNVHLDLWGVDAASMVRKLRLQERFDLTGSYNGRVDLAMRGTEMEGLSGWLLSQNGGVLMIKDTSMLKQSGLAAETANLVVENLKNCDYDIGKVVIREEDKNPRADVSLAGASGVKNINLVWHRGEDGKLIL